MTECSEQTNLEETVALTLELLPLTIIVCEIIQQLCVFSLLFSIDLFRYLVAEAMLCFDILTMKVFAAGEVAGWRPFSVRSD